jgi:hypothetical protein
MCQPSLFQQVSSHQPPQSAIRNPQHPTSIAFSASHHTYNFLSILTRHRSANFLARIDRPHLTFTLNSCAQRRDTLFLLTFSSCDTYCGDKPCSIPTRDLSIFLPLIFFGTLDIWILQYWRSGNKAVISELTPSFDFEGNASAIGGLLGDDYELSQLIPTVFTFASWDSGRHHTWLSIQHNTPTT